MFRCGSEEAKWAGAKFKWSVAISWRFAWRSFRDRCDDIRSIEMTANDDSMPYTFSFAAIFRGVRQQFARVSERAGWRKEPKRLQICETLNLGNRGFLALVHCDGERFLVGGTNNSISLLAPLHGNGVAKSDCAAE